MIVWMYSLNRAFLYRIKPNYMNKSLLFRSILVGMVLGASLYGISKPHVINADFEKQTLSDQYEVEKTVKMVITAYSSAWEETTGIPGKPGVITASGKHVEDGIIANNMLPFGTKIRIPELYGDKVFIVQDRMHRRKGLYHVDIWMPEKQLAKNFGAKITEIEVLES